ncbi:beta-ketoacyl synthase N-terminal-like domain-containing protein [Wukongibacter baidiensis]|uniref:beta-ketoacyl synthase N-terminal-like domain-containing protein n=1 Tax=Wukongibacter baidiensis TaxID=1723361 RepID=UPI003D7F8DAD
MKNNLFYPLAIVGYGCVLPPDGYNADLFWETIISGKSGIRVTPKERWNWEYYYDEDRTAEDKTYCKLGAYIEDYKFPYQEHEYSDKEINKLNRAQLMMLDSILQALSKSQNKNRIIDSFDTGLFLGNMLGDEAFANYSINFRGKEFLYYLEQNEEFRGLNNSQKEEIKKQFQKILDNKFNGIDDSNYQKVFHSTLAKSVRDVLNIKGTTLVVDAACSAGALVIDEAVKHLQNDNLKTCIVSGVLGNISVTGNVAFAKVGGLSPTHSAPLDITANGLIPGEGAATIIVKRLDQAVKDNDNIYAVIRGVGTASDGKGKSIYAPSSAGQVKAMKKALEKARLKPRDVEYIEAHATGTKVGDKVELGTIKLLYEDEDLPSKSVAIGTIKSQIGHSFSAAGMANLIKVLEGMQNDILPPTHDFTEEPEGVELEKTPFYINTSPQPWTSKKEGEPRRASVNAFGFGGINASVVVEEYKQEYHRNLLEKMKESKQRSSGSMDVAVVGVGCIDSESVGAIDWWKNIGKNKKVHNELPKKRWNEEINEIFSQKSKIQGSFIEKLEFPWLKYKIPPKILAEIDKGQQMGLMAAGEAIEDYGLEKLNSKTTGVYVGSALGMESSILANLRIRFVEYFEILKEIPEFNKLKEEIKASVLEEITKKFRSYIPKIGEDTLPGYMDNITAGRIANFFNIQGPNVVVDSDSTSFINAIEQGVMSLESGENDTVVVGGVHANMTPELMEVFNILKSDKKESCSFCGSKIEDFVMGEGAVFFVLKKFSDVSDEDKVYARIKGLLNKGNMIDKSKDALIKDMGISHYECCNSMKTENGKNAFYFGAQAGFALLKVVLSQHHKNLSNLNKANEKAKSNLTSIYSYSILGGDYMIFVDDKDSKEKIGSGINVDTDKVNQEDIRDDYVFYLGAQSFEKLCEKANSMMKSKKVISEEKEYVANSEYRLAIVYKNYEELLKKLKMVR